MKVKDLVEELKKFDQESTVKVLIDSIWMLEEDGDYWEIFPVETDARTAAFVSIAAGGVLIRG